MVTKGEQSPWVRAQAVEALNFQIGIFIGYVICSRRSPCVCIGALLLPAGGPRRHGARHHGRAQGERGRVVPLPVHPPAGEVARAARRACAAPAVSRRCPSWAAGWTPLPASVKRWPSGFSPRAPRMASASSASEAPPRMSWCSGACARPPRQLRRSPLEATRTRLHPPQKFWVSGRDEAHAARGRAPVARRARGGAGGGAGGRPPARRSSGTPAAWMLLDELRGGHRRALAEGHQLDEARGDAALVRVADQGRGLVVVDAAHDDDVELERVVAGLGRRVDAAQRGGEVSLLGDAAEGLLGERVQAHVELGDARLAQGHGQPLQVAGVGGDGQALHARAWRRSAGQSPGCPGG